MPHQDYPIGQTTHHGVANSAQQPREVKAPRPLYNAVKPKQPYNEEKAQRQPYNAVKPPRQPYNAVKPPRQPYNAVKPPRQPYNAEKAPLDWPIKPNTHDSFSKYTTEEKLYMVYSSALRHTIALLLSHGPGPAFEYFTPIDDKKEVTSVRIVALDEHGRVFILCWKNRSFEIPGGSVKSNETFKAAASRELEEETGIFVPPYKFVPSGYSKLSKEIVYIVPIENRISRTKTHFADNKEGFTSSRFETLQMAISLIDNSIRDYIALVLGDVLKLLAESGGFNPEAFR